MNALVHNMGGDGSPARMTSTEIAVLLGVRHDSVRRTIERLVDKAVIACPPSVDVQEKGGNNRTYTTTEYVFEGEQGKRDSYIVVAQLSPEFTARLVDRWQELEARPVADPIAVLNDPAAMRGILLTYTEKVIALESRVAEMEPDVAALERIAVADGSLCFRDAAKVLQVRPKDLTEFMMAHHWVYQRPGVPGHIAYQAKLQAGLLEHKTTTVHRSDGSEKVVSQCRITPKGLARLAREFPPVAKAA